MTSTLRRWLAGRTPDDLQEILRRRSDILYQPLPRDLNEVAARLHYPHTIVSALDQLPQPCLELLETLIVFGSDGITRVDLATVLHVGADDPGLDAALRICGLWAVAWDYDGKIHCPGALRTILPQPLSLGPRADDLLTSRTVDDLRRRTAVLGVPAGSRKADILASLGAFYADGEAVRRLAAKAPDRERAALDLAARHDPVVKQQVMFMYPSRTDSEYEWLITHSLVIVDWQTLVVPREVGIAMRGADWHPTLTPRADLGTPVTIGVEAVDGSASAAANAAIEGVTMLVEACGQTPIATLKAGGVGVREVRRLAKLTGLDGPTTEFLVALALKAGLLSRDHDEIVPTTEYDGWSAGPAPDRLVTLLRAWLEMRTSFGDPANGNAFTMLRRDTLARAADWPAGTGFAAPADLERAVFWYRPVIMSRLPDAPAVITAIWDQARLLGLAAGNAISSLGRALAVGADEPGLHSAATSFVHAPSEEAIFQADLTVIVPGSPSPEVTALLDAAADRESRGAATTWRISAASARRALDAGWTADELLDGLRGIAAGGTLPQTLEYLITDTARRHGTIRVRTLSCVVRADDPALLQEIAATRSLAKLGLSVLAPTLLASRATAADTLAALRSAGYAPVGENADGTTLVEKAARRRVTGHQPAAVRPLGHRVPGQPSGSPAKLDLRRFATDLLARPVPEPRAPLRSVSARSTATRQPATVTTLRAIRAYCGHLSPAEQSYLLEAIDQERPIWIRYVGTTGKRSERVIEPIDLDGRLLTAYCQLREDERNFALDRIEAVRPG